MYVDTSVTAIVTLALLGACSARLLSLTQDAQDSGEDSGDHETSLADANDAPADAIDSNPGDTTSDATDARYDAVGSDATSVGCPSGYVDWFSSSFAETDRDVVGSADFPSMPWVTSGSLKIRGGRLTGKGSAAASQGLSLGYPGLRARLKVRFSDSSQRVSLALNGADDGSGGVVVVIGAAGEMALLEGGVERGRTTLSALETARDWFVEVELGAAPVVRLSADNYGSQAGVSVLASVNAGALAETEVGKRLSLRLDSAGELGPAVDEIAVARCGLPAPAYQAVFADAFERPDSTLLGNADLPAASAWSATTTNVSIARGALYFFGTGGFATVPVGTALVNDGLRLRFAFHGVNDGTPASILVGYNFDRTDAAPGFFLSWKDAVSTSIGIGNHSALFPFPFMSTELRYVQIDADGPNAVLTVRSGGYTGPVLAVHPGSDLAVSSNNPSELLFSANHGMSIDEVEVARYASN